jgi:biopolymer transport protein ExbB
MRGYGRFRVFVLSALLIAAVFASSHGSFAQTQPSAAANAGNLAPPGATSSEPKEAAGLMQLILSNLDPVFWTIAVLSVAGLTLIIRGAIQSRAAVLMPETTTNQLREMLAARKFREVIDFTETDPSFVSKALNPALKRAPSFQSMKEAMETAIGEQTAEAFRSIEYLNIIGNLGPLLGLLGTVLGMIKAFSTMQAKGGATTPADLAGGVSIALCHTFLGLFLAIPCLAAFGWLRTVVDRNTIRGALIAEELLLMIKPADAPRPPIAQARPVGAPLAAQGPTGSMPQPPIARPAVGGPPPMPRPT